MGYSYKIILEERVGDHWVELEYRSDIGSGHSTCCHYFYTNLTQAVYEGEDARKYSWYVFPADQVLRDYGNVNWKGLMRNIIESSRTADEAIDKIINGEYLLPYWRELEEWALMILSHPDKELRVRYGVSV